MTMVDIHSTAQLPGAATLVSLAPDGARHVLEANAELRKTLAGLTRAPEFFQVPMPDGAMLNALRILPPAFDSTRKYPVLMYVYGGPTSQTVLDDFGGDRYLWHEMLARKGIIVIVSVDNRGTGVRAAAPSATSSTSISGSHESDDQIAAAKWLGDAELGGSVAHRHLGLELRRLHDGDEPRSGAARCSARRSRWRRSPIGACTMTSTPSATCARRRRTRTDTQRAPRSST